MSTICSPFSSKHITSNFSSSCIVFLQFFIWIVLGNVDLCFSINSNAAEEKTKWATCLCHKHNQSIHMTDGVVVTSFLLASCRSAATDHLCQITLNGRLSCKLDRWCKFSRCVKEKSHKKISHKKRSACTFIPSSQEIQRSPRVRKHAAAWRAIWWIHPSCLSCVITASIHGNPVWP